MSHFKISNSKWFNFQIFIISNSKISRSSIHRLSKFFKSFRYPDLQKWYVRKCFHILTYIVWSISVINKRPGSIFGHIFGRSKNDPKSIGIHPESLISNFGIIKNPKDPPRKYVGTPRTSKTSPKMFAAFWAPLDPVFGLREVIVFNYVIDQYLPEKIRVSSFCMATLSWHDKIRLKVF